MPSVSKTVLVVGGAGYIGSLLVPALIKAGHQVSVLDVLWFGNNLPEDIEVVQEDFFNLDEDDLRIFDTVIFLAGLSNDPMADFSPSKNFIDNGAGPAFLAYMSRKAGVGRFIHGGSCSVYGNAGSIPATEHDIAISNYPYGISKLIGEKSAMDMIDDTFSVIALRKGTVSGWSPRMRFDLLVNTMFRAAMTSGVITVNNPSIWRPVLSIEDAVHAYICAVDAPKYHSGIYNIASINKTVGETSIIVKSEIERITDKHIEIKNLNNPDKRNYRVNWISAKRNIGYQPDGTVEGIVGSLHRHWPDIGNAFEKRYSNIDTFKGMLK